MKVKKMAEQKEKHPVYRLVMAGLIALLLLGVALLVVGIRNGSVAPLPPFDLKLA